jgi:hypothetical protein
MMGQNCKVWLSTNVNNITYNWNCGTSWWRSSSVFYSNFVGQGYSDHVPVEGFRLLCQIDAMMSADGQSLHQNDPAVFLSDWNDQDLNTPSGCIQLTGFGATQLPWQWGCGVLGIGRAICGIIPFEKFGSEKEESGKGPTGNEAADRCFWFKFNLTGSRTI